MSLNEAVAKYRDVMTTLPPAGTILKTSDGSPASLIVQVEKDKPPFIYGRAYPSEVLNSDIGWYLRSKDDSRRIGWKCILLSAARRDVVKKCPEQFVGGEIYVRSLKVIRASDSGKSLLCEVNEYWSEIADLKDVLPLEFDLTSENLEGRAIEYLKGARWTIKGKFKASPEGPRILEDVTDPNGTTVTIVNG